LITKVYIPKYIFPFSKVLSSALNLLFSMIALYLIVIVEVVKGKITLSWVNIFLPYDLVCIIIFAIGVGLILSTLAVFFRDMFYIYGVVLTAWMYLTPVMYPISMIENSHVSYKYELLLLFKLNPMYHFINYARTIILYGNIPTVGQHLMCLGFALITLLIGTLFFRKMQDKFIYFI
jgi:ABC-2 type transport system permease protein